MTIDEIRKKHEAHDTLYPTLRDSWQQVAIRTLLRITSNFDGTEIADAVARDPELANEISS